MFLKKPILGKAYAIKRGGKWNDKFMLCGDAAQGCVAKRTIKVKRKTKFQTNVSFLTEEALCL